jgi:anti-sigma factor RsiW
VLHAISRYLDNDLPASGCEVIKRHLAQCLQCDRFVQSLKRTINLCRKADVAKLAASDKTKLRNRVLAAAARL